MGRDKRAYAKQLPSPKKEALAEKGALPTEDNRPVWRFRRLDWDGPFACTRLGREDLARVVQKLAGFETMTWPEIERAGSHFIPVRDLASDARKRLEQIRNDDVDALFSLRIAGAERVFGIRDRWLLYLLWWDPDHAVCPSTLKHT